MWVNTNISDVIAANTDRSRYDTEVKKVLSDKTILAWIMKYSIEEFSDFTIEEIRDCIEGEPEIGTRKVLPGHSPEVIVGNNTEDSVPGEGTVTYDICFYAIARNGECRKLIINVEAQNSFYPGYDIVTRAVFYCARMLSAQYGREFTAKNYDDIKKVYSIWICMNVPRKMEYTIAKYSMAKEDVYGYVPDTARYDLLDVVIICFGKEENVRKGNKLHKLLNTLITNEMDTSEKRRVLEQEYGIVTSVEMEGGLQKMCNLSEMLLERGYAKGMVQGIEQGTLKTILSLAHDGLLQENDAANRLGVSIVEFRKMLQQYIVEEKV